MFSRASFNQTHLMCILNNQYSDIFPWLSKSSLQVDMVDENEYLRDLSIELNNVAVDLYKRGDYSFAMDLYKDAMKGIMATVQEKNNRVVTIKEAKNNFIPRIVEGKERLHKMTSSLTNKGFDKGLSSYQWSGLDCGIAPLCLSEAIKISTTNEYTPESKQRYICAVIMMHNISLVHVKNGELDVAENVMELAIGLRPFPNDSDEDMSNALIFATVLNNLGYIKYRQKKIDEACEMFSGALDIGNQTMMQSTSNNGVTDKEETVRSQKYVGTIFFNVGIIDSYLESDDKKIKNSFEHSLMLQKMALGHGHPDIATIEHNIGMIYLDNGRVNEAQKHLMESLKLAKCVHGYEHEQVAKEMFHLGHIHAQKGEYDQALHVYKKTLRIQRKILSPNHTHSLITMCEIGKAYHSKGNFDKALSVYDESLVIAKKNAGTLSMPVVSILCKMCKIYVEIGEICKASNIHQEVAKKIKYFNKMNISVDKMEFAQISYLLATPPTASAA